MRLMFVKAPLTSRVMWLLVDAENIIHEVGYVRRGG